MSQSPTDGIGAKLVVLMPDGSRWSVPILPIARNRARHYASEFDGDIERSLNEDTLPLFRSDDYEVYDWAQNNMNWSDVVDLATKEEDPDPVDYQDGWVNGDKEVIW